MSEAGASLRLLVASSIEQVLGDTFSPAMTTWLPDGGMFVSGKPLTDIWAPPGLRWRDALLAEIKGPLHHPRLRFVRSDKSWYDLDNLTYPVVAALGTSACESIWSTVIVGSAEGVEISDAVPPPPPADDAMARIYITTPNTASVAIRPQLVELEGWAAALFADHLERQARARTTKRRGRYEHPDDHRLRRRRVVPTHPPRTPHPVG